MRLFVACALALLALTAVSAHFTADGVWWDLANGFGFIACGVLLCVCILIGRPAPGGVGLGLHRHLGWAAIGATGLHIALMLADETTFEYVQPGAPGYMWAGLGACVPLLLLALSGLRRFRRRWFADAATFRRSHVVWTFGTLVLVNWHVLGSGFYLSNVPLQVGFVLLTLGVPTGLWFTRRYRNVPLDGSPSLPWHYALAGLLLVGFVLPRLLLA